MVKKVKTSKEIKIKEIPSKIKIIEKTSDKKDESILEREVDDSGNISLSVSQAPNTVLRRSNEIQSLPRRVETPTQPKQDSEFMMSKSYNSERRVSPGPLRGYQAARSTITSVDHGITQNNFIAENNKPREFRNKELDSMGTESSSNQKYQEFEALPEDTSKNKRRMPWEL